MRFNTAQKYQRLMTKKYSEFQWSLRRLRPYNWVVVGTDGEVVKEYDVLDCAVNC